MSILPGIYASQITGHLSTNSYESIATVTVGAGGQSSISFSSIPSTYKHLQIRSFGRATGVTTDANVLLQFNSDATAGNYPQHTMYGTGSSVGTGYSPNDSTMAVSRQPGASSSASMFGVGISDVLDYTNTNKYKTVRSLCGHDQNGSGILLFNSGLWKSTSAVTSITITTDTAFAQYSQISLYGIKG